VLISDLAVKRPTIAIVVNALLVVFGLLAFSKLPLRQYPDIDPPVIGITAEYRGASAEIVDTKVTQVIEDQLSGIEGIKFIDSTSSDGQARITVEFELDRNIEAAVNDVQQSVNRVLDRLPDEVDPPEVAKADTNARPIMWFNMISTTMDELELSDYARRIVVDRLSVVDGVAQIRIGGERSYAMRIELDRRELAARGLTVNDIEATLRAENVELPAGEIESVTRDFSARVNRVYNTPKDFASMVVRRGEDGHLVRLGEVARVALAAEEDDNFFRREGVPMIGIGVIKQSQANTVDVANRAREAVALMNQVLPEGTSLEPSYDSSIFVDSAIREVYKTLAITMVLVVLVIFAFLGNARATLIPAVTVPVSLIAAFIFVSAMGFTINILTLLALVLAIGLVVDDSIVVLENIFRRVEHGEPPLLAAYRGARQVGFAVIATTLVLVAVFVPLVFLEGNIGRLFTEFALTIAAAVSFSSLVALSLSPVLGSRLLVARTSGMSLVESLLVRVEDRYRNFLRHHARRAALPVTVLLLASATIFGLARLVPSEFSPVEDNGILFMNYRGPEGASFEQTSKTVLDIEKRILDHRDDWGVEFLLLRVPGFGANSANSATAIIGLVPWAERDYTGTEVGALVRKELEQVPDGRIFVNMRSGLVSGASGQPVEVAIGANTYDELIDWRGKLLEATRNHPVLQNADINFQVDSPQIIVDVDRQRAADLGVSVINIGRTLETMLGSRVVTTYMDRSEEYNVILEGLDADFTSPDDLEQIYVRSERTGSLVSLGNLVTVRERAVAPNLPRYNRRRALTLSADLAPGYRLDAGLEAVRQLVQDNLPASASLDYRGESLEYLRAGSSVQFVFMIAILVAYLVLAAQFESFLHPVTILLTVPLGIAGAFAGLYLTGQSFNIYSQIGMVMLIGLAAKNGILIVEFANQLRDQGHAFEDALVQASVQRLRPILMTSMTTVIGSIPLLLAFGAGAESRYVLGVVIFSGVLAATLLTLFVLPSTYLLLSRNSSTPGKQAARIHDLETRHSQEG